MPDPGFEKARGGGCDTHHPDMKKPCCDTMKAQLNYQCDEHGIECPDVVIRYSEDYEHYTLYSPNAEYCCNFCPWCGEKLKGAEIDPT